jgi:hypothetical protein
MLQVGATGIEEEEEEESGEHSGCSDGLLVHQSLAKRVFMSGLSTNNILLR